MVVFQPYAIKVKGLLLRLGYLTLSFITVEKLYSSLPPKESEDLSFTQAFHSIFPVKPYFFHSSSPSSNQASSPVSSPRDQLSTFEEEFKKLQVNYSQQLNALVPSTLFEGVKRHIHTADTYEMAEIQRIYGLGKPLVKQLVKLKESVAKQHKQLRYQQRKFIQEQVKQQRLTNVSQTWNLIHTTLQDLKEEQAVSIRMQGTDKGLAKEIKKYQQLLEKIKPLLKEDPSLQVPLSFVKPKKHFVKSLHFIEDAKCLVYSAQTGEVAQQFLLPLQANEKEAQLLKNPDTDLKKRSFKSKRYGEHRTALQQQMTALNRELDIQDMQKFAELQTAWQKASTLGKKQTIRQQLIDYFETCRDFSRAEIEQLRFYIGNATGDQQHPFKNYKIPPPGQAPLTEGQAEQLLSLGKPIHIERTYIDMGGQSYSVIEFYTQEILLDRELTSIPLSEDVEESLKVALAKARAPVLASNPDPLQDALNFLRAQDKYQHRTAISSQIISDEEFKTLLDKKAEAICIVGQRLQSLGPKILIIPYN